MSGFSDNPVDRVAAVFGGQTRLGAAIGKRQSLIWKWKQAGRVPSRHIPTIIEAAGRLTPPVRLEPNDFFPTCGTRLGETEAA